MAPWPWGTQFNTHVSKSRIFGLNGFGLGLKQEVHDCELCTEKKERKGGWSGVEWREIIYMKILCTAQI